MLKKDESYLCCLPSYEAYMILGMIEKRMVARGGQFLAANTLSWADLHFMQVLVHISSCPSKFYTCILKFLPTSILNRYTICNSSCLHPV